MKRTADHAAIERFLDGRGLAYRFTQRGKHYAVVVATDGRNITVFFPATPSDRRGWLNVLCKLPCARPGRCREGGMTANPIVGLHLRPARFSDRAVIGSSRATHEHRLDCITCGAFRGFLSRHDTAALLGALFDRASWKSSTPLLTDDGVLA